MLMMTATPYDDASLMNGKHCIMARETSNIIMRSISSLRQSDTSFTTEKNNKSMKQQFKNDNKKKILFRDKSGFLNDVCLLAKDVAYANDDGYAL
ncbi:MAG: hypothetical protein ACI4IM_02895 [Acutalibacteraceae bacterium]